MTYDRYRDGSEPREFEARLYSDDWRKDEIADDAMTLVRGLTEQVARLTDELAEHDSTWSEMLDDEERRGDTYSAAWQKAESEAMALRKAIENAPHDGGCWARPQNNAGFEGYCTCWKSKALLAT